MVTVNECFLKLPESYLFSEIARKIDEFESRHPASEIIRLGIGDVTRPLVPSVIRALHAAVEEMGKEETFRGYGPEQGYEFLREVVLEQDFHSRGIGLLPEEIFISDGAKSDIGNITEILGRNNRIAVTDPVYPVYIDTNVMGGRAGDFLNGRTWSDIVYLPCTAENGFIPELPQICPDVIYLCLPNNPTGIALSRTELKKWVDYALENDILILFDAAYEAYIQEPGIPHSIYEIEGAKRVAIEFRSFSKTAGFTGLRCGYTVVPEELEARSQQGGKCSLNRLWNRRQCTKFNGVPYIVQRAAEAVYSPQAQAEVRETIGYYMENACIIRNGLREAGFEVFGGVNAPYIWLKIPGNKSSWEFFDVLLQRYQIAGTPGIGFGPGGEGYFRLTAFGERASAEEAVERFRNW